MICDLNLDIVKLEEVFVSPAGARMAPSPTSSDDSSVCQFQKSFLLQYETRTNKDTGAYSESQANVEVVFASRRRGNAPVCFIASPLHRGEERRVWFRRVGDLAPCLAGVRARKREHSTWEQKRRTNDSQHRPSSGRALFPLCSLLFVSLQSTCNFWLCK